MKIVLRSFKAEKNTSYEGSFFAICNFVFFLHLNLVKNFIFFIKGTGKGTICLTVQQILGNSTEGNLINLTRKIPMFFVAKYYIMVTELRQDRV